MRIEGLIKQGVITGTRKKIGFHFAAGEIANRKPETHGVLSSPIKDESNLRSRASRTVFQLSAISPYKYVTERAL